MGNEASASKVSPELKKRRVQALKRLMADKQRAFRERHLGCTLPVLLETDRRGGDSRRRRR